MNLSDLSTTKILSKLLGILSNLRKYRRTSLTVISGLTVITFGSIKPPAVFSGYVNTFSIRYRSCPDIRSKTAGIIFSGICWSMSTTSSMSNPSVRSATEDASISSKISFWISSERSWSAKPDNFESTKLQRIFLNFDGVLSI